MNLCNTISLKLFHSITPCLGGWLLEINTFFENHFWYPCDSRGNTDQMPFKKNISYTMLKKISNTFVALTLVTILISCSQVEQNLEIPLAKQGVLDLRDWDFERNGSLKLNGDWEFYWNKNILFEIDSPKEKEFIWVPGKWNDLKIANPQTIPGHGYASFKLKVLVPPNGNDLGFYIEDGQGSAYEMYIDGELVAKNGKPSLEADSERAIYLTQYGKIYTENKSSLDVVMIISNHVHKNGGFQTPIKIDTAERIFVSKQRNYFFQIFLLGVLLIIALYHLSLFFYRKKDTSALWFGILCLVMTIRLVFTGERLFMQMFPNIPFSFFLRMEYLGFYSLIPPFFLFLNSLFPEEFKLAVRRIFIILPSIFIAIVILTPIEVFTSTLLIFQVITLLAMAYVTYILIQAVRFKRKGARLMLIGFSAYFIAALNDLLFYNFLIGIGLILPYGLFFFIFTQAAALAHRIGDAFNISEELSSELEQKVQLRTRDLEVTKEEIVDLNQFTSKVNSLTNLELILQELSKHTFERYGILGSWLLLPNDGSQFLLASKFNAFTDVDEKVKDFLLNKTIPLSEEGGFLFKVFKSKKPLYLRRIPKTDYAIDKELIENIGFTSFLIVPLVRNNQCIGITAFTNFDKPMLLSKKEINKISNLCFQIAGSIDNNHLLTLVMKEKDVATKSKLESEKQKKFAEQLNLLIKSLNENLDIKTIMQKVHLYINSNFKLEYYGLSVLDSEGKNLIHLDSFLPDFVSTRDKQKISSMSIPVTQKIGAHALAFKYKRPIYALRVKKSALSPEEDFIHNLIKFESLVVIPLILQNKPIGFLDLYNLGKMKHTKEEITYLSILGEQLAGIIYSSNLYKQVEQEREKSDKLLENILPKKIAEELKSTNVVKPQLIESATVLFTDFVGFTQISEKLSPEDLIRELDGCFSQFDEIILHNNLEKLKTIGDAYMCAGGLPVPNNTHAIDTCLAAMEFRSFMLQMGEIKKALELPFWELRIGIHTGPVTAGVIGNNKFAYDIWGDSVNTASRMESSGEKGEINISGTTYEKIKDYFECDYRGKIKAKGKGEVDMYFLKRLKSEYSMDEDGLVPNSEFIKMRENLSIKTINLEYAKV